MDDMNAAEHVADAIQRNAQDLFSAIVENTESQKHVALAIHMQTIVHITIASIKAPSSVADALSILADNVHSMAKELKK